MPEGCFSAISTNPPLSSQRNRARLPKMCLERFSHEPLLSLVVLIYLLLMLRAVRLGVRALEGSVVSVILPAFSISRNLALLLNGFSTVEIKTCCNSMLTAGESFFSDISSGGAQRMSHLLLFLNPIAFLSPKVLVDTSGTRNLFKSGCFSGMKLFARLVLMRCNSGITIASAVLARVSS